MIKFFGNSELFEDPYIQPGTLEDIENFLLLCKENDWVSLDIETTGLNFVTDSIVVVALDNGKDSIVIDYRNRKDILTLCKPYLETLEVLGANIKFDYKFLRKVGIRLDKVFDVILAERLIYNGYDHISKSLENIVSRRLSFYLDKSYSKSYIHLGSAPLRHGQIKYAAEDVLYLPKIKEQQQFDFVNHRQGSAIDLRNAAMLENFCTLAIADMEYNGLKLDKQKWLKLYEKNKKIAQELKDQLDQIVLTDPLFKAFVPKYVQGDLFDEPKKLQINWNSPAQVLPVFQTVVPYLKSVEADAIQLETHKHKIIQVYITFKEYNKRSTTYGKDFLKYIDPDGFIHTDYSQIVRTGRMSSKQPNLQNIPADNEFRNCFIPNFPDYVYVSSDYDSQELALIAHASKDPVWLNALKLGHDLHSVCAELVYGKKWKKAAEPDCAYYQTLEEEVQGMPSVMVIQRKKCKCPKHIELRQNVKTINFGLAYGMSEHKLSHTLNITLDEAKSLIELYFTTFPHIRHYLNTSAAYSVARGYAETLSPWKRVRFFPGWSKNIRFDRNKKDLLGSIERQSKNTPIQGGGGDMVKYAVGHVRKWIHQNNAPVFIVNVVHDQIDTICTKEYAQEWGIQLKAIMEKAALATIPSGLLTAGVTISDCWKK